MKHLKTAFPALALLVVLCLATRKAISQEYFYRIYQFETPYQGHLGFNLFNTYVPASNQSFQHFDKNIPDKNLTAHSIEAEYGLTDHMEVDAYADFESPANDHLRYIRSHFSALYRIGERFDHFVNVALYAEYYFPKASYGAGQEAEFRLILDKDLGDFRLVGNPAISKTTTGEEKSNSPEYSLNAGVYYRRNAFIQPGLEYFANYSTHTGIIFPTITAYFGPSFYWNIGAGFGLNNKSDKVVLKSILTIDLMAIRPSKLFRKHA